jgi:hypothetical protein
MQLKIGNAPFAADTTFINRSFVTLLSAEKIPYGVDHNWTVTGNLLGDGTQANLILQQNALMAAVGRQYQDLTFFANDQTVAFRLPNAGSTSGVIYTGLTFPGTEGAEFATKLAFSFTASATYPYSGGPVVLEFSETLSVSGGGPKYDFTECVNALPIKALITPHSVCRVTQRGTSKVLGEYRVPGPLFSGDLMEPPDVEYTSPKRSGQGFWEYVASWTYTFAGAQRIDGYPTRSI